MCGVTMSNKIGLGGHFKTSGAKTGLVCAALLSVTLLLLVSFAAADTGRSDGDSDGDTFSDSVFMYQITSVANKEARIFTQWAQ